MATLSLRAQLAVILMAFAVALAAALGWLAYGTARGIVMREAERAVGLTANARKQALLAVLERQRDHAGRELEAGRAACDSGLEARDSCLGRWLRDIVSAEGATAGQLAEHGTTPLALGAGITPLMRATLSAPPDGQVARFSFDEQGRPYYVVWARSEDGNAALALRFESSRLEALFLDRSGLGDSGEAFVVDENGVSLTPLRYLDAAAAGQSHPVQSRPMQACLTQQEGEVLAPTYHGAEVIHGFRYVPEIGGGCIMAHIHAAEAFAPVTALQGRVLTVTAAFTAVAIVLSLATAGWVARPLRRLADRTRELQAGDFGSPVPVEGPAEVRTLARTFAGMAHSLQEALAQEREARAEAETGRQRAALLAEASRAYAEAGPGAQRVLDAVAHLVATVVGDACTIFLVTPDGATLEPVAAYDQDPAALALLKELIASRPWGVGEGMAGRAVQTGQPVLAPEVDPAAYRALLRPEHREGFERYGAHSVLSVPLRVQGRPVGAVSLARHRPGQPYTEDDLALAQDLADRAAVVLERARLFEAEREARQAAEAAVGLRDEFLSVAAHELKTPMTGLRLAVQHLLRRLDRGVAPEPGPLRQALGAVEQQSAKASRLVAQLLETSRLEAGRLALDRRVENLSALVAGVVEQARARTSRHDVVLSAPPEVRASVDALRLEQVLTNLLDNALKFSPAGGQIDVEVSAPDTSTVRLAVRDRGLGIPPEHRGRIFERFHQAHAREHRSGLGIGLYMSRGIVELHGGQMWAEFPPDGGTCFVVTLPTGLHAAPSRPEQEAMA